jgi:hypothetical protein
MNKLKHTPGPWKKDYGSTDGHIKSIGLKKDDGTNTPTVCRYKNYAGQTTRFFCADSLTDEEVEANGILIATAPEMLDYLINRYKNICKLCEEICEHDRKCDKGIELQNIIERATGLSIDEVLK